MFQFEILSDDNAEMQCDMLESQRYRILINKRESELQKLHAKAMQNLLCSPQVGTIDQNSNSIMTMFSVALVSLSFSLFGGHWHCSFTLDWQPCIILGVFFLQIISPDSVATFIVIIYFCDSLSLSNAWRYRAL